MKEAYYLGLANELSAKFGRINTFVSHRPSIGSYHEEVLKSVLKQILPDRFKLRTGFVFDPEKGASQQGDILIVDEHHPDAYFFREGDFSILSSKGIACVIEVKSQFDKKTFTQSVDNLASFQTVIAPESRPLTLVFAYHGPTFKPERLDSWYKSITLSDEAVNYPSNIFVLNRGLITLRNVGSENMGHYLIFEDKSKGNKLKCLSIFLQVVRKAIQIKSGIKANPFEQALFGELVLSAQYLRYGTGYHQPYN